VRWRLLSTPRLPAAELNRIIIHSPAQLFGTLPSLVPHRIASPTARFTADGKARIPASWNPGWWPASTTSVRCAVTLNQPPRPAAARDLNLGVVESGRLSSEMTPTSNPAPSGRCRSAAAMASMRAETPTSQWPEVPEAASSFIRDPNPNGLCADGPGSSVQSQFRVSSLSAGLRTLGEVGRNVRWSQAYWESCSCCSNSS
jgi:hypothetical protein